MDTAPNSPMCPVGAEEGATTLILGAAVEGPVDLLS